MTMHDGHRKRVKEKILLQGTESMALHELFEALLFYAIPYKDTNPLAHVLCDRFGTPAGIFHATEEELLSISGIGKYAVGFLHACGQVQDYIRRYHKAGRSERKSLSREDIGELLAAALRKESGEAVYLLLLNNRMECLSLEKVFDGPFSSAAFRPQDVIRLALLRQASFAAIGYNHASFIAVPSASDLTNAHYFRSSMESAGVPLIVHVLVAEHETIFLRGRQKADKATLQAVASSTYLYPDSEDPASEKVDPAEEEALIERLLLYGGDKAAKEHARSAASTVGGLDRLLRSNGWDTAAMYGKNTAVLLRTLGALVYRTYGKRAVGKHPLSIAEIAGMMLDFSRGSSREVAYLFLLDRKGCLIDACKVGEGVTNSALFSPRQLLELAIFRNAAEVVLAHNHPDGVTTPSEDDIRCTGMMMDIFQSGNIRMRDHLIVTEHDYLSICSYLDMKRKVADTEE